MTRITMLAAAAVIALLSLLAPSGARAQCTSLTFTNNTSCTLDVTLYDASMGTYTFTNIPPGGSMKPFPAGFTAVGLLTVKGNMVTNPVSCQNCVTLHVTGAPAGVYCCATLCFRPNCQVLINPVTPCTDDCL